MGIAALLLASLAASQGQAVQLRYPDEPGLTAVEVNWNGRFAPLVKRDATWLGLIGVDLDTAAGDRAAEITFRYDDGRMRIQSEPIAIGAVRYPTTELTVEPRYVELSPEDQARVALEDAETSKIYSTVTPEAHWNEPFASPIPGITSGRNFGHRRVFNGEPRAPHSGVDLKASTGTPIRASNRGRVVLAKELFFSGNAVFIDHGLGVYSAYLHLSAIDVAVGSFVERGEVIGLAGATGRVTGPHLHWGARVLNARIDPFSLLRIGMDAGQ
jgi:murein DD-endopeptidase MepM/ murein hydrolase activator NlpD